MLHGTLPPTPTNKVKNGVWWLRILWARITSFNRRIRSLGFQLSYRILRALRVEGKPKYVKSSLQGEPDSHWNLILPQISIYKVVSIDSLKLQMGGGEPF